MTVTDADIVAGMVGGLQGPIAHCGSTYFRMRISGVGCAWRPSKQEFAFRDPRGWLTDEMAARWSGAPVIVLHPPGGTVDGETLGRSIVGTVIKAFVDDGELMGVVRIIDEYAAAMIIKYGASTSPAVVFSNDDVAPIELKNGDRILVERNPILVDHLAVTPMGVWDKGDEHNKGVESGQ